MVGLMHLDSNGAILERLIYHVVLPEKLPTLQEASNSEIAAALTERLLQASRDFKDHAPHEEFQLWDDLRRVILTAKEVSRNGQLCKVALIQAFHELEPGGVIILHVREQNAGVLISRPSKESSSVVFEAFEASPRSEDVLAAADALQWDFPGAAAAIPYKDFSNESFQDSLAHFLQQSSSQALKQFAARARKSGSSVVEIRDTTDPAIITHMLMTLLESYGARANPPVLRKRVRDDVCWSDGAEMPWRRCPDWLVLRVGLARYLCNTYGGEVGRARYKFLMCLVLAKLLRDCIGVVNVQLLHNLKAKLARRLAKLETQRRNCSAESGAVYEFSFSALGSLFSGSLQTASAHIESEWAAFKRKTQKPVRPLPSRAEPANLTLSLPKSSAYLESIILDPFRSDNAYLVSALFDGSAVNQASRTFGMLYHSLNEIELEIEDGRFICSIQHLDDESVCAAISKKIESYLKRVGSAYDGMAEQKSLMLLTILDLWTMMDRHAVKETPLLSRYHPGFSSGMLSVLHLPRYADMCRLQRIKKYLDERSQNADLQERTIFEDPSVGCFAERYYDEYDDSGALRGLHQCIEEHAEQMRKLKEKELAEANDEYEKIEREIAQSSCIFIEDRFGRIHDDHNCKRCFLFRKKRRMRIHIHEHPLPSDLTSSKAVVFELHCPAAFTIYRRTTWRILHQLGYPRVTASAVPRILLQDYAPLQQFARYSMGPVSLASTKKSFLDTHYRSVCLPADVSDVCLPSGLKLGYYDCLSQRWPGRRSGEPSFAHHFRWAIPPSSALACLSFSPTFAVDSNGPSSHEIIASQTKCPAGVSVLEFMAYQGLFAGKHRRWPSILIELGSSNLNFSKEETTAIIAQLAVQAGPAKGADPLRLVHCIFRDEAFCSRLLFQIQGRLDVITANWRETNLMDLLITLLLRIATLAPRSATLKALDLLDSARRVTGHWIRELRDEIHQAKDSEASRRCSRYALWAALLCRRTYATLIDESGQPKSIKPQAVQCLVEASIALQDNLLSDPATLPASLKQAVVRDLRMRFLIRGLVRKSIECSPDGLTSAINTVWPRPNGGEPRIYSSPKYLNSPQDDSQWVEFEIDGNIGERRQTVHYEMNEGHLLIDQKPLGRLPAQHRASFILEELFGKQSLLTYPSSLRGMTHMLSFTPNGHQIHIGLRNGLLYVRAYHCGNILELIPRTLFADDLPASLVENCVHWLNVRTGQMEVRQRPDIWHCKPSNWIVNVPLRLAHRRTSTLVDPHSPLFRRVAHIFHRFEHPARLTVYQPERWKLSVELRRLELSFHVNNNGLLYCNELKAEIDPDQDAGTWYGLDSKIVVRDVDNPRRRSILVPMGELSWSRNGCHVAIGAQNVGNYGIFTINDVLGRVDCQCEGRLLYMKAQLHAFTSFVLPDPLTHRTGTEEALHCLGSSLCQPWMPLNPGYSNMLDSIAKLTPKRMYYPKGLKSMQQVFWDPNLTTNIQNDQFWSVISAIYDKSSALSIFSPKEVKIIQSPERGGNEHLSSRSKRRRRAFWRRIDRDEEHLRTLDIPYEARDRSKRTQQRAAVYEAVSLIRSWDARLPLRPDLASLLSGLPNIQGHGHEHQFNKTLLSDLLEVDIGLEWGSLVDFCRRSTDQKQHALSFLFGMMSFCQDRNMDIIRVLVAFAASSNLKAVKPPAWPSYSHFRHSQAPSVDYILQFIDRFRTNYMCDEQGSIMFSAKLRRRLEKEELEHKRQSERDSRLLAQFLAQQWPCAEPTFDGLVGGQSLLIDISRALEVLRPKWLRLFQNWEFSEYITKIQQVLDQSCLGGELLVPELCTGNSDILSSSFNALHIPSLGELLEKSCLLPAESVKLPIREGRDQQCRIDSPSSHGEEKAADQTFTPEIRELQAVVAKLTSSKSTVRQDYGDDLRRSLDAIKLGKIASQNHEGMLPVTSKTSAKSELLVKAHFDCIREELHKHDVRAAWLSQGGLWPCISPVTLLESLRSTFRAKLQPGWRKAIIEYALSITELQRLRRSIHAGLKNNPKGIEEEERNPGHKNWSPTEHPDWLLLEIDANILIRPDQVDVALATISPASGGNSVLQMNMGQGKTSCIMPMVAAVLANSSRLVRVIVPKALLLQTAQTLQARLGTLLGREVRHVPFSRKTPTAIDTIKTFLNIHRDVMECSGIIVALPEHVMSFSLSGIQRLSDGRHAEAVQLVKTQKWMRKVCRDVLDECDFTLAVRTQLVFPSGRQNNVDGYPDRWELAEALLKLVEGHLWNLCQSFPRSIEIVHRQGGGYPWVFFLRKDVEEALVSRLVEDVVRGRVPTVPLQDSDLETLEAVKTFISEPQVSSSATRQVESLPHTIKKSIYQLRGLLVHRILLLTLKKRWNVQYGLHPLRDPIAVPYYAKGVPSDQSEWGHPDVAILFTCLSFYFAGLNTAQLRECLQSVLKADDPSSRYDRWVESVGSLPGPLREWNIINVDDEAQLSELWGHFRYSVVVIDYFLNHSVFPKHAKQFQTKIQASGWDIPYFDPQSSNSSKPTGGPHRALTSGFSGTNDNRTMLPLTIKQHDLPGLQHTNADVLTYLLQPRNRGYFLAADSSGKRVSEMGLLERLRERSIRMLIDAGAQILEMDNKTLVKAWMGVDTKSKAALYFKDNKPVILYRNGTEVPLLASPFVDDLRECLVYLDEAHTRGTDLKMPGDAKGALTLGLGQTKDHTVQAAMRLRQLASTQSVVFVATPEVHQSVLDHNQKAEGALVDSCDVVCWLLEQTCAGIEQLQPLYYSQGVDFCRRAQAVVEHPDFLSDMGHMEAYLKEMRRTEHQTVEKMYQPRTKVKGANVNKCSQSADITLFRNELDRRRKGFQDVGQAVQGIALQEVEQEREVTQEVEAVREVQKPSHVTPLAYGGLHGDIATFVRTGKLAFGSPCCEHLSVYLTRTATGRKHRLGDEYIRTRLLISREFSKTVALNHPDDRFLRPVNWVLWCEPTETALVVTPEEAEDLIPLVRKEKGNSHLLTYASPVTKKMLHFNGLRYFSIPELAATWNAPHWMMIELGLLAGRVYFQYEEYSSLAKYFGFPIKGEEKEHSDQHHEERTDQVEHTDRANYETETARPCLRVRDSTAKTLEFLQEWLALRRKGQDFVNTPMGSVCGGKLLSANHPFFSSATSDDELLRGLANLEMNN